MDPLSHSAPTLGKQNLIFFEGYIKTAIDSLCKVKRKSKWKESHNFVFLKSVKICSYIIFHRVIETGNYFYKKTNTEEVGIWQSTEKYISYIIVPLVPGIIKSWYL